MIVFLFIMAILTAFVGSMGLTGAMSINVLERTREIGVMRTIGAVDRVIMQSVIIEGLVISLITWVLAIGVSFPIGNLLLTIISEALRNPHETGLYSVGYFPVAGGCHHPFGPCQYPASTQRCPPHN